MSGYSGSRYLSWECDRFKSKYLKRIENALYEIDENYGEMDFENAVEKEKYILTELNSMKTKLQSAYNELSAMRFE